MSIAYWPFQYLFLKCSYFALMVGRSNMEDKMGFATRYIVQAYRETKRGNLVALPAIEARDADHARRLLERRLAVAAGVIAFSRRADPDAGQYEDPVILLCRGRVPDEDQPSAFRQS